MKTSMTIAVLGAVITFGVSDASGQDAPQRGAGAQPASGPTDPTLELAKTKYSPDQWPRGERRNGFVLEELSLPGLTGEEVEFRSSDVARGYVDAGGTRRV